MDGSILVEKGDVTYRAEYPELWEGLDIEVGICVEGSLERS